MLVYLLFITDEILSECALLIGSHGGILSLRPCPLYACSLEMPHMCKFDKQEVSDCKSCASTARADISGGHTNEPAGRSREERGERLETSGSRGAACPASLPSLCQWLSCHP